MLGVCCARCPMVNSDSEVVVVRGVGGSHGLGGVMTFVASCSLVRCLENRGEVPLAKHVQIPTSIMRVFPTNMRTDSTRSDREQEL